MAEVIGEKQKEFVANVVGVYESLLTATAENKFVTDTRADITEYLENMSLSNEKTAELFISFSSNLASSTIAKTMDQSIIICEKSVKIDLETTLLQAQIDNINSEIDSRDALLEKDIAIKDAQLDLIEEQANEVFESATDRREKRPLEVANLENQGKLILKQIDKLEEDKLYVVQQKDSMVEQVGHNKIIKAMDAMGDMIGTLGAGGMKPSQKMFEVFFELNQILTEVEVDDPITLSATKA